MQKMCCQMKSQDAMTKFMISLNSAMDGQNTDKFSLSFFDREGRYVDALLSTNKRTNADGAITGVICFLQIASSELQQVRRSLVENNVSLAAMASVIVEYNYSTFAWFECWHLYLHNR